VGGFFGKRKQWEEIEERHRRNEYNIGEKGPAGGIVFYDKGKVSDGWRYLEAAPSHTEFTPINPWGMVRIGRDLNINGYKNWRLPTTDEMGSMRANRERIGGFSNAWYAYLHGPVRVNYTRFSDDANIDFRLVRVVRQF
jgi:hypothetical protein